MELRRMRGTIERPVAAAHEKKSRAFLRNTRENEANRLRPRFVAAVSGGATAWVRFAAEGLYSF